MDSGNTNKRGERIVRGIQDHPVYAFVVGTAIFLGALGTSLGYVGTSYEWFIDKFKRSESLDAYVRYDDIEEYISNLRTEFRPLRGDEHDLPLKEAPINSRFSIHAIDIVKHDIEEVSIYSGLPNDSHFEVHYPRNKEPYVIAFISRHDARLVERLVKDFRADENITIAPRPFGDFEVMLKLPLDRIEGGRTRSHEGRLRLISSITIK